MRQQGKLKSQCDYDEFWDTIQRPEVYSAFFREFDQSNQGKFSVPHSQGPVKTTLHPQWYIGTVSFVKTKQKRRIIFTSLKINSLACLPIWIWRAFISKAICQISAVKNLCREKLIFKGSKRKKKPNILFKKAYNHIFFTCYGSP